MPDPSPPQLQPAVVLKEVKKAFVTPAGQFYALRGVDLTVEPGEFVAIVGKSGSGKSTMLNMITGIDKPSSGTVMVAGTPVHSLSENQTALWRGTHVGVVFQFFQLMPTLSCMDNIMLPMDFAGKLPIKERNLRALELLQRVDMVDQAHKLPSELSGGQQQRIAIARALANDPPILTADEPTGNLDSRTADMVFGLFAGLAKSGRTVIMVTHDAELAARTGRAVVVADGVIVSGGGVRVSSHAVPPA